MCKELKLHYTFTRHNQLTTDSGKMVQINQKKSDTSLLWKPGDFHINICNKLNKTCEIIHSFSYKRDMICCKRDYKVNKNYF